MVYYGVLSKGCERCRQRKVKCDQRKPECLRCEKAKIKCPGFRNLTNVSFRDESERIIRRARTVNEEIQIAQPNLDVIQDSNFILPDHISKATALTYPASSSISRSLSYPVHELGAHFFFTVYNYDGYPFTNGCQSWLIKMYFESCRDDAIRAVIEAVGMALVSNMFNAPNVASKSKERYCRALAATNQALNDPTKSIADSTLMVIILFGAYELITCESWDQHRSWVAHLKGATTLLQLRGHEQFHSERGGQLYRQIRSQLLLACMQHDFAAPDNFIRMSDKFIISEEFERRQRVHSGSVVDTCFRYLDLRSSIKCGNITDPKTILKATMDIDRELAAWTENLEPSWSYTIIDADETIAENCFDGKFHVYKNLWTTQIWNNWRFLRILTNEIIIQIRTALVGNHDAHVSASISLIHQLSTDICTSTANFLGSSRAVSLIFPLFVVSKQQYSSLKQRNWAIEQLRIVNSSLGLRQAALLADTVSKCLNEPQGNSIFLRGLGDALSS